MKIFRRLESKEEHEEIDKKLSKHEKQLRVMANQIRNLEIEAGIYRPPGLKEINGT